MSDETIELGEQPIGWTALERATLAHFGGPPARSFKTVQSWAEGGNDPLGEMDVYAVEGPPRHWCYIGYGLSELEGKESSHAERSGWGIELTFRLARGEEADPPTWPLVTMQSLARYVMRQRRPFAHGHYIAMGGPIGKGVPTEMVGLAFAHDPGLGVVQTANGACQFLLAIGVTKDELEYVAKHDGDRFFAALALVASPLLITDVDRKCIIPKSATREAASPPTANGVSADATESIAEADAEPPKKKAAAPKKKAAAPKKKAAAPKKKAAAPKKKAAAPKKKAAAPKKKAAAPKKKAAAPKKKAAAPKKKAAAPKKKAAAPKKKAAAPKKKAAAPKKKAAAPKKKAAAPKKKASARK